MEYRKAANADGRIGESEVNGNASVWGTIAGITTAEQNAVGVAIFPHRMNRETTFFADDTSYGFLFAQATPFTVDAGATRSLRYRTSLLTSGISLPLMSGKYHIDNPL